LTLVADYRGACAIEECLSFNVRKTPIDILLLHYTGMQSADLALSRLTDPNIEVSCHYMVDEEGAVTQMVAEKHRAWHAGPSFWRGSRDINSRSVGIEIVNPGHEWGYRPFPDIQIEAVIALSKDIVERNAIPPELVLAHSDIAPDRKEDPGELFPWDRLYENGIGHWVEQAPITDGPSYGPGDEGVPVQALQSLLAWYGYDVEVTGVFDRPTELAVIAFQRHFRQEKIEDRADLSTIDTLKRLCDRLR